MQCVISRLIRLFYHYYFFKDNLILLNPETKRIALFHISSGTLIKPRTALVMKTFAPEKTIFMFLDGLIIAWFVKSFVPLAKLVTHNMAFFTQWGLLIGETMPIVISIPRIKQPKPHLIGFMIFVNRLRILLIVSIVVPIQQIQILTIDYFRLFSFFSLCFWQFRLTTISFIHCQIIKLIWNFPIWKKSGLNLFRGVLNSEQTLESFKKFDENVKRFK